MLTADQAATIARRHGLGIADAAALRALADDEASADKIASKFATSEDDATRATRQLTRNIFQAAADSEKPIRASGQIPGATLTDQRAKNV